MALNDTEREWVRAIISEAAKEVMLQCGKDRLAVFGAEISQHEKGCSHGKLLAKYRSVGLGVCIGLFLSGGTVGMALARLF